MSGNVFFKDHPTLDLVDAESRVLVHAINSIGTSAMEHYGDLSPFGPDEMGSANGSWSLKLTPNGITLRQFRPQGGEFFQTLPPSDFNYFIQNSMGPMDFRFLCRKLELGALDMDKIHGRNLTRVFCDNRIPPESMPGNVMKFYRNSGEFDVLEFGDQMDSQFFIFEVKFYKLINSPGVFPLYFKPEHSRLYLRPQMSCEKKDDPIYISSDLSAALECLDVSMAWYQNCGNPEGIDWGILRQRESASFIWAHYPGDSLATRNSLAEALGFLADAQRQKIHVNLAKVIYPKENCGNPYSHEYLTTSGQINATPARLCYSMPKLTEHEIFALAEHYRISIDPALKDPYRVLLSTETKEMESLVPDLIYRAQMTYFFGGNSLSLLPSLLLMLHTINQGRSPQTLLLIPPEYKFRITQMLSSIPDTIGSIFTSDKIQEQDGLSELFEAHPEIILLMEDDTPSKVARNAMDRCLSEGKTVIFFNVREEKDVAIEEIASGTFVAATSEKGIIAKNMKDGKVRKYYTDENKIIVCNSSETELENVMKQK